MRKVRECNWGQRILVMTASLILVLALGFLPDQLSIVSNAQSQGKVIANSANIRKSADPDSEVIGSAAKDASVTVNNQVTASDNTVWYQVFVDADTLGYIRSDLVEITDGTTPPKGTDANAGNAETPSLAPDTPAQQPVDETPAEVSAVEPVSAKVTGGESIRVRANASTTSKIVSQAKRGLALTVTGQANGSDGKVWYQVNFISDGNEVVGFIRSDYVELSGELTAPVEPEEPETEEESQEPEEPEVPEVKKDWDTQYDEDTWYLVSNVMEKRYKIDDMFDVVETLQKQLDATESKVSGRTVGIVVLVILVVIMAGVIAYLVFKVKDMTDSAYFAEVEKETVRRRTADRPANSGQKVMHTVGTVRNQGGARTAGKRPVGAQQGTARPAGARPAGAQQGTARPAGTRPAGAQQGTARPTGTRPIGAQQGQATARPSGAARPGGAPMQNGEGQTRRPAPKAAQNSNTQNPGWKSKNFMTDDDEFEFEFLNWDGEEQ